MVAHTAFATRHRSLTPRHTFPADTRPAGVPAPAEPHRNSACCCYLRMQLCTPPPAATPFPRSTAQTKVPRIPLGVPCLACLACPARGHSISCPTCPTWHDMPDRTTCPTCTTCPTWHDLPDLARPARPGTTCPTRRDMPDRPPMSGGRQPPVPRPDLARHAPPPRFPPPILLVSPLRGCYDGGKENAMIELTQEQMQAVEQENRCPYWSTRRPREEYVLDPQGTLRGDAEMDRPPEAALGRSCRR